MEVSDLARSCQTLMEARPGNLGKELLFELKKVKVLTPSVIASLLAGCITNLDERLHDLEIKKP